MFYHNTAIPRGHGLIFQNLFYSIVWRWFHVRIFWQVCKPRFLHGIIYLAASTAKCILCHFSTARHFSPFASFYFSILYYDSSLKFVLYQFHFISYIRMLTYSWSYLVVRSWPRLNISLSSFIITLQYSNIICFEQDSEKAG